MSDAEATTKRKDPTASGLFWDAAVEIRGAPAIVLGLLFSAALKFLVSWKWAVCALVCILLALLAGTLARALSKAVELAVQPRKMRVLSFVLPIGPYRGSCHGVFVVHAPDGLQTDATISFSVWREAFLTPVGLGTVHKRQDDLTYHVTLDLLYDDIDVHILADKNKTNVEHFDACYEVSLAKAKRSRPVVKGESELVGATSGSDSVTSNTAISTTQGGTRE